MLHPVNTEPSEHSSAAPTAKPEYGQYARFFMETASSISFVVVMINLLHSAAGPAAFPIADTRFTEPSSILFAFDIFRSEYHHTEGVNCRCSQEDTSEFEFYFIRFCDICAGRRSLYRFCGWSHIMRPAVFLSEDGSGEVFVLLSVGMKRRMKLPLPRPLFLI